MRYMDIISSGEFRKTYQRLTRPVIVTVNGHPIGVWSPRELSPDGVPVWPSDKLMAESAPRGGLQGVERMKQAERDAILRRVSKGE